MKPILVAVARPHGLIARDEHRALLALGHLRENELVRRELSTPMVEIPDLRDYSGLIITGSPYGSLAREKSQEHRRIEAGALALARRALELDFPTLGLCYGLQILALAAGGSLTHEYAEDMGAYPITLTPKGMVDPLTSHLPHTFYSYVAHSESLLDAPKGCTVLASSPTCPIHLARFGKNIYGTQHHPEIDTAGIRLRIDHYVGVYLRPEERDPILAQCTSVHTEHGLISTFVECYGRSA